MITVTIGPRHLISAVFLDCWLAFSVNGAPSPMISWVHHFVVPEPAHPEALGAFRRRPIRCESLANLCLAA
jgi:hypothetical protein